MTINTSIGMSDSAASHARVLLVDDEVDILPEYQELLEMAGLACLTDSDPEAALRRTLDDPGISVVVTDLKMARMNGAELIRAIRAGLPGGRTVRFIVLTGDASSDALRGESDIPILLKPVDFDALTAAIQSGLAATA